MARSEIRALRTLLSKRELFHRQCVERGTKGEGLRERGFVAEEAAGGAGDGDFRQRRRRALKIGRTPR